MSRVGGSRSRLPILALGRHASGVRPGRATGDLVEARVALPRNVFGFLQQVVPEVIAVSESALPSAENIAARFYRMYEVLLNRVRVNTLDKAE